MRHIPCSQNGKKDAGSLDDVAVNERASLKVKGKKEEMDRMERIERERERGKEEKERKRGFYSDRMEEWEASPNVVSADQVDTGIVLLVRNSI